MSLSFTVEAPELAKGLSNALAFVPAASRLKYLYLTVNSPTELLVIGTDMLAAGMETIPIRDYQGPQPSTTPIDFLIGKGTSDDGATALEKAVRGAGKVSVGLTFNLSGLECSPMGAESTVTPLIQKPESFATYRSILGLFLSAERRQAVVPGVICIDPSLLSRFAKVKADKTYGRMADFLFGEDELDRVLVKIGPSFKGLVMPIDREVNGENIGSDGLW